MMRFLRPSLWNVLLPLLLIGIAFCDFFVLRLTLYALLAAPLRPWTDNWGYGWVYSDKPDYLTPKAAQFAAIVWAPVLYLTLCGMRLLRERKKFNSTT